MRRPILATCPAGGWVLDPFCGTGTTLVEAARLGRNSVGFEIVPEWAKYAKRWVRAVTSQLRLTPIEAGAVREAVIRPEHEQATLF